MRCGISWGGHVFDNAKVEMSDLKNVYEQGSSFYTTSFFCYFIPPKQRRAPLPIERAMATTQTRPSWTAKRPNNTLVLTSFFLMAVTGLLLIMVEPISNGLPVGFREMVMTDHYPNGTPIIRHYTGVEGLDLAIVNVANAFVGGALRWDPAITVHQLHLLVQFLAVITIFNIEACRVRNKGSLISRQSIWGVLYQTCGGGFIIPLMHFFSLLRSDKNSHLSSGRAVPLHYAKALLPAVLLGYLVPTLALYFPWNNLKLTAVLAAAWQLCPQYANILLFIFSSFTKLGSSTSPSRRPAQTTADIGYLKTIYKVIGVICLINHLVTLYFCFTSTDPKAMLSYIFIPDKSRWQLDMHAGLHYMFQMDWIFIHGGSLAWALLSAADIKRLAPDSTTSAVELIWDALKIVASTALVGPGAVICGIWSWREDKMVLIEQSAGKEKAK